MMIVIWYIDVESIKKVVATGGWNIGKVVHDFMHHYCLLLFPIHAGR